MKFFRFHHLRHRVRDCISWKKNLTMESIKRPAKRPLGLKKSLASAESSKKSRTENEITLEIDEKVAQNDFQGENDFQWTLMNRITNDL